MAETLPRWIFRRDGIYYYKRHVPTRFQRLFGRPIVKISLETRDLSKALVARDHFNELTEAHWRALARGEDPEAGERYLAAIERARLEGFSYQPIDRILGGANADTELLDRIAVLEEILRATPAAVPAARRAASAILGGEPEPGLRLSTLFGEYEKLTKDERRTKSDQQLHKWRLPHQRAVANAMKVLGDKPVAEFARSDANAFRAWWSDRVAEENLSPDSANKDMTHLGKMIAVVSDRLDLGLSRQFRGLRMASEGEKRPPYSTAFIRDVILAPGALAGLNEDARAIVLVMIETGARPIEIAHLRPANIMLDGDIPHISIEPGDGYTLKTKYSKRQIPLIGVALDGARVLRTVENRYRDNTGSLSATVNKYMGEQKPSLLETEDHSLYSFRHGFKDRLTEASAPDIVDAALMGHKFDRPDYGKGPSLALKFEWIKKIAVSI